WGAALRATVDHNTRDPGNTALFNLTVEQLDSPGGTRAIASETFRNISGSAADPRFVNTVLDQGSTFVRVRTAAPDGESPVNGTQNAVGNSTDDGNPIADAQITGNQAARTGIFALESADLFNLLCIPPLSSTTDVAAATWSAAAAYCQTRRAVLII